MADRKVHIFWLFRLGAFLWIAVALLGTWVLKTYKIDSMLAYVIALMPIAPSLLMLTGLMGMIRRQDELYRRIQFEAIAFAAILVWLLTLTWGVLEVSGLVTPLPAFWIASALVFLYGFGGCSFADAINEEPGARTARGEGVVSAVSGHSSRRISANHHLHRAR